MDKAFEVVIFPAWSRSWSRSGGGSRRAWNRGILAKRRPRRGQANAKRSGVNFKSSLFDSQTPLWVGTVTGLVLVLGDYHDQQTSRRQRAEHDSSNADRGHTDHIVPTASFPCFSLLFLLFSRHFSRGFSGDRYSARLGNVFPP